MDSSWGRSRHRASPVNPSVAGKVPPSQSFLDLSDLAGPLGRWLAVRLVHSPITPIHLTLAFTVVGLAAALLLAIGRGLWPAAALLVIKSALDAADGGLARARRRPSRVGRFLDSDCDFIVNVALYAGIAAGVVGQTGQLWYVPLAFLALVTSMLQVSVFNHYYVRYRQAAGGDRTSQVSEDEPAGYAWDDPALLGPLFVAYRAIYGWQDALVARLEQFAAPNSPPPTRRFMTAVSVLGLGTQLLLMALCTVFGHPEWALWLIVTAFNGYAAALLLSRRGKQQP
jgi:phosphatidylglycerophosphate synthase